MGESAPEVTVIIISYNEGEVLSECLVRVGAQRGVAFETVLVDNASTDDTVEYVRREFPWVRIVRSDTNLGFAGGVLLGVRESRTELVALINNDARPEPLWLASMLRLARAADPGDLVSSIVINDGTNGEALKHGWTINLVGRSHRNPGTPPEFLFFPSGGGMLFSRAVHSRPFPPFYFIYEEDTYLGWSARLKGHRILAAMDSIAHHRGSATMRKMPFLATFHSEKNRLTNNLVFWSRATLTRTFPLMVADFLVHSTRNPWAHVKALAWVLENWRLVLITRRQIQAQRRVPDSELLRLVSSRVSVRGGRGVRVANALVQSYCRAMQLETLELSWERTDGAPTPKGDM